MPPSPQPRQVVDSHVLAATSHPLRRRLLDVLTVRGPSTTTRSARVGAAVAQAALSLNLDRHVALVREWYATEQVRDEQREHWEDAAFSTDKWLHLTSDELAELSREMIGVLDRWMVREVPDDGQRREPVTVFACGVPATP